MSNPNFDQKLYDKMKREHSEFLEMYDENSEETDLDYFTEFEVRRFLLEFVSDENRQLTLDEANILLDKVIQFDDILASKIDEESNKQKNLYLSFSVDIKKMILNMIKVGE